MTKATTRLGLTARQLRNFWAKADKSGDCWTWTAYTLSKGYGQFWVTKKVERAHRVSWVIANGEIPDVVRRLRLRWRDDR